MKPKSKASRQALLLLALATATTALVMPASGQSLYLLTEDGKLATVSSSAASSPSAPVTITGVTAGESLVAIDVRPQNQQLYALGVNATTETATLYLLEPRTALAVPVGTASQVAFTTNGTLAVDLPDPTVVHWDIDFNPTVDRVRVVAGSLNFRLNPNTGAAVDGDNNTTPAVTGTNPDGAINGGTTSLSAGAYTNNRPNSTVTTQYTLDDASNSLFIQNPPNAGTQTLAQAVTLGGNSLDFSRASLDIRQDVNADSSGAAVTAGSAIMVARAGGATSNVYSLNLVNAAATLLGDTGLAVRNMAILTEVGAAISLSSNGATLNRFDPATPGTLTSVAVGVASLAAGESLVGIDSRPQTGQLYGLAVNPTTDTGTLYLIDPQSGALTAVGAQSQIAFLNGTASTVDFPDPAIFGYGVDFDPTADRLRVVGGSGLNFRVNPITGAPVDGDLNSITTLGTNPDATLNGLPVGSSGATGAAYTNSYAQSLTGGVTTLYTLDSTSKSLYIQNPPNAGTQTSRVPITVGGSPLTFVVNGFDIPPTVTVGTSSAPAVGEGWFTATVAGSTNLYRVDLTTGVAKSFGAVGAGSTAMAGLVVWSTVSDISVERPAGTALVDNAGTVAFGNSLPGTPVTANVTLRNLGSLPLTYSTSFDTGTSFSATVNGSGTIPGSSSVVLTLSFNPAVTGPLSDTLRILSNDPDLASFEVALTGTGAILQTADSVTTTTGATRLNPLVNDTLAGDLTIIGVSDPLIVIQGRTLILPSGYTGQFTYTISNGSVIGQGIVTATAGVATVTPTTYNGVLVDSTGKVVGWSKATVTTKGLGSIRLITTSGNAVGRMRFPTGITALSTPTTLGPLTVDRKPGGVFGSLSIGVVLKSGAVFTGVLHAEKTSAAPVIHHFELASIDPAISGGAYGIASVDSRASVRLRGILPDGNPFSASTVVTDNSAIAFFTSLRLGVRPSGVFGGDLTLANYAKTDLTGELVWSKPPQGPGSRGTELGGVDTLLQAYGSVFDPSVSLFSGSASLGLTGGNLLVDETSSQIISGGVPSVPVGSLLSWSASPSFGTFSFTVDVPSFAKPVKGSGVYLQKSNRAVGHFSGSTKGGRVVLSPSAP